MAKFVFRLASVLKQRLAIERTKQAAVAALESRRVALEQSLRDMQRTIDDARAQWREMLHAGASGAVSAADIRGAGMQAAASFSSQAAGHRIVIQLAGVHTHLKKARAELVEAMKARRAIELLREKQLEEWKLEQRRLDTNAMDEIASRISGSESLLNSLLEEAA
jgi:hypothetical protein